METSPFSAQLVHHYLLQWSHGPLAMETSPVAFIPAGDVPCLQWSHGPLAMETAFRDIAGNDKELLQWSHGPLAMET